MLKINRNGSMAPMQGKQILTFGQWQTIKSVDKAFLNGAWHRIGTDRPLYSCANYISGSGRKIIMEDIDPVTTFGSCEKTLQSNFFVINGRLYYYSPANGAICIDKRPLWAKVSGNYSGTTYAGIGICDGKLYRLTASGATSISTLTGWTHICGMHPGGYGYGIREGLLYQIGSSVTQFSNESGWTHISGRSFNQSNPAFGIRNGILYSMLAYNNSLDLLDDNGNWTNISGSLYGIGIRDGMLFYLKAKSNLSATTMVTQLSSDTGWTEVVGTESNGYPYFAIRNGALYYTHSSGTVFGLIDSSRAWSNLQYGMGIADGNLCSFETSYELKKAPAVTVLDDSGNCIKAAGRATIANYPAFYIKQIQ